LKRGGHAKAMGMKIFKGLLESFHDKLDFAVKSVPGIEFYPEIAIDHLLQGETLQLVNKANRDSVDRILGQINRLEPYGQRFERPIFAINGRLKAVKGLGGGPSYAHARVMFEDTDGVSHSAVLWNISEHSSWFSELEVGGQYTFAVEIDLDTYNGAYKIGLKLKIAAEGLNAIQNASRK
jgi:single-stranded DNA-specific DHH superfamily exonuclease